MIELLDDFGTSRKNDFSRYAVGNKNKRLANYLIDFAAYLIFTFFVGIFIGITLISLDKEAEYLAWKERSNFLGDWLFNGIVLILYYVLCEYFLNGKTLGKLLTKTRAVTAEGEFMDFPTALSRSFVRVIPFEPFSFLGDGTGWHDNWSKTMVVDESQPLAN